MKVMKTFPKYLLAIILLVNCHLTFSQTFFQQGFETGVLPTGWSESYYNPVDGFWYDNLTPSYKWKYNDGGYSVGVKNNPDTAYNGNFNAMFQVNGFTTARTRLVSPVINISSSLKPVLKFYNAQLQRYYFETFVNDELKVYYRTSIVSPWKLLADYTNFTETWVERKIDLPADAIKSTLYIAFEGKANSGWGTCFDEVSIYESGVFPKKVNSITVSQTNTMSAVSGATMNPIARININISGNTGSLNLENMSVASLNTNDNDVLAAGVKLFTTTDSTFTNATLLASASFVSSTASFTGINKDLVSGDNYIWVTYNLANTAIQGNVLDIKLLANSVKISGANYPTAQINPNGSKTVEKGLFFDDFETPNGWTLVEGFQIDTARGLGGTLYGNPDPAKGFSGSKVMGTILNGTGDYNINLTYSQYSTTSTEFNCKYFSTVKLSFMRWLNIDNSDRAYIFVSNNGGASWQILWSNESFITDKNWIYETFDISEYAARKEHVKIRFSLGTTNDSWNYSGWNIDNLTLYGHYLTKDVGVSSWKSPITKSGHTANEVIEVYVRNYSAVASPTNIPIVYSLNGGQTIVLDTIEQSIPGNDSILFTFTKKANLSVPNIYANAYAETLLAADEDLTNNRSYHNFMAQPTYKLPLTENFEGENNFWITGGVNSSWVLSQPYGRLINTAPSGDFVWITNLADNYYYTNENSYVQSPSFAITDTANVVLELKYNSALQKNQDGAAIYSSIDNGSSWQLVPKDAYNYKWNWYTSNAITGLGAGWDTTTNGVWTTARQVLPHSLLNKPDVKFRVVMRSDGDQFVEEGFAFDDFSLLLAPTNIKIEAITSHASSCQLTNPDKISFQIRNIGIRTMLKTKDTIIAGFKIGTNASVIDTLFLPANLPVNQTTILTFNKKAVLTDKGTYTISVFDIDPKPRFYPVADKDTLSEIYSIWENPVTGLNKIYTASDLAYLTIQAATPGNVSYLWSNSATGSSISNPTAGKNWLKMTYTAVGHNCTTTDTFMVQKLVKDVGVDTILSPQPTCKFTENQYITFRVRNFGNDTIHVGDTITTFYSFKGSAEIEKIIKLSKRMLPGDSLIVSYANPLNMSDFPVGYAFTAKAVHKLDNVPANNEISKTIHATGYPSIELGPDIEVTGSTATLDAGAGLGTYLWNDGSTQSTYEARFIGKHWVRVTSPYGCVGSDTVHVNVVFYDVRATALKNVHSSCTRSNSERISIRVNNVGTDTLLAGKTITMKYSLNGGATWVQKDTILQQPLFPNAKGVDSLMYTFTTNENLSATGDHPIQILAFSNPDVNTSDILHDTIRVFGNPAIELGANQTITALQYTLHAQPKPNLTFLWNNMSTDTLLTITQTTNVTVQVTDVVHNCVSNDAALITLNIKDGLIEELSLPSAICKNEIGDFTVRYVNNGSVTIPSGEVISFNYRLNGGSIVSENYTLLSNLAPSASFIYAFEDLKDKVAIGSNKFVFYSSLSADLRLNNDTLTKTIVVNSNPIVNISPVDTVVTVPPYRLTAPASTSYNYFWPAPASGTTNEYKYDVMNTGKYSVVVTNKFTGCAQTDSVYVSLYKPDGRITASDIITAACSDKIPANVTVWFKNIGESTMNIGDPIYFDYKINNEQTVAERIELENTINPGDSISHTFIGLGSKISTGSNTIKFFSVLTEDMDHFNDTLTKVVTLSLAPSFEIYSGGYEDSLLYGTILSPDLGSAYSYLWNDNSTIERKAVTQSGLYKVVVTNKATGCFRADSVFATMVKYDGSISKVYMQAQTCEMALNNVAAEFTNLSNVILKKGDMIRFSFIANTSPVVFIDTILKSNLAIGSKMIIAIPGLKDKLVPGTNSVKVFPNLHNDSIPSNDTTIFNILVHPLPNVDFKAENDTLIVYPGSILNVDNGSGFTYNWSNGSTEPTIPVTTNGLYKVTVKNNSTNCVKSDSVNVLITVPDGQILSLTGDPTACLGIYPGVRVLFKNGGDEQIQENYNLEFRTSINGTYKISQYFKLTQAINPGASAEFFVTNINKSFINGINNIQIACNLLADNNKTNDVGSLVVTNNGDFFDLAGGTDTINFSGTYKLDAGATYNSYLWSTNENTKSIIVNATGWYKLKVDNGSCTATDSVYLRSSVSVEDQKNILDFNIYPNPASVSFTLELQNGLAQKPLIEITSIDGRLVFKKNIATYSNHTRELVDVSNWQKGLYIISVYSLTENVRFIRKVVVQ
jgi:hypothetical protein